MIKFGYTILYVKDVVKTIGFYEKAFGFERTFIAPDNSYGELGTGSTTLSFAQLTLAASNLKNGFTESDPSKKPSAFEIAFTTDDVESTYKKAIKEGAIAESPASVKPQGQTVAYVRDPDGFLIEICTPMH